MLLKTGAIEEVILCIHGILLFIQVKKAHQQSNVVKLFWILCNVFKKKKEILKNCVDE